MFYSLTFRILLIKKRFCMILGYGKIILNMKIFILFIV